jgi:hypothetical protein
VKTEETAEAPKPVNESEEGSSDYDEFPGAIHQQFAHQLRRQQRR